jgi:hypothetical protein
MAHRCKCRQDPARRIKLAQQCVSGQPGDPSGAAYLRATNGLAREFWFEIIAEGVEDRRCRARIGGGTAGRRQTRRTKCMSRWLDRANGFAAYACNTFAAVTNVQP